MNIKTVTSSASLEDAYHIRRTVFIEEQNVSPDEELDGLDNEAIHLVGYIHEQPIAAARLRFVDEYGKLERICVLPTFRGNAYGKKMIEALETVIIEQNSSHAKLNAQSHAKGFYQLLGYEQISDEFVDAGILHVTMTKQLR
ncbi:GNAT family N-acetyltransferase [Thalassobacillus sp. CUG 92003]|uniref:GNAT family N-acetyltransferase n=1 Tax=Thalassobacillus sp. CUG 92003 TaxID=2736641 RepID=UPI0015E72219|nr:GNAT family N-acetyltransferase [Thalassobacillus sp. CUG 92003]